MGGRVIFRRIRGHIVPIQMTDRQWDATEGAATAGAGVAAGVLTGHHAAKLVQKASKFYVKSRNDFRAGRKLMGPGRTGQISFTDMLNARKGAKMVRGAAELRKEAVAVFRSRNRILGAGLFVSSALVGAGYSKLREAVNGRKATAKENAQTAAAVGATAALATYGSYYRKLPVGGTARVLANVVARAAGKRRPFKMRGWNG